MPALAVAPAVTSGNVPQARGSSDLYRDSLAIPGDDSVADVVPAGQRGAGGIWPVRGSSILSGSVQLRLARQELLPAGAGLLVGCQMGIEKDLSRDER